MAELSGYDSEVYHSSEPESPLDGYECSSSYCSKSSEVSVSSRSDMSDSRDGYSGQDDDFESSDSSVMEPSPYACSTAWDSDNAFTLNDIEDTDTNEVLSDHNDDSENSPNEFSSVFKESFFKQLYDGSNVVYIEAMILIFQYALKYSLTNSAVDDLLKLVHELLPKPNVCLKTAYSLKKLMTSLTPDIQISRHIYCSFCNMPVADPALSCHGEQYLTHFVTADIEKQLKGRFKDNEFWNLLQRRPQSSASVIYDIYDGAEYSKHCQPGGFLCRHTNPANISFMFNTDGVSLFHSSKNGIWPVYLAINELPPSARFSVKNVLLCGVWYCYDKPNMHTYLKPIVDTLNRLYKDGIDVCTPEGNKTCRGMMLTCTVDLPARAAVCNMKGFNGAHSCTTYLDSGDNTVGSTHMHRYWPFNPNCEVRSLDSVHITIVKASETGNPVSYLTRKQPLELGYKRFPIFALHRPFHLVNGVVVDYLHCVLLGVVKMLMEFWFTKSHRSKPYYIGTKDQLLLCNERLLKICLPDIIKRKPRSVDDCAHWKGTEFQGWLLWYSLPVLQGLLPPQYYQHFSCLVAAVGILLETPLTRAAIDSARSLLDNFCSKMEQLYGSTANRMNIHLLRHLAFHVINWGPLWVYSCFSFESLNGELKKYFHGTRNMSDQLMLTFMLGQSLPKLIHEIQCVKLFDKHKGRRTKQYSQDLWRVGVGDPFPDFDHTGLEFTPVHAVKFYRVDLRNSLYYCREYKRTSKTNNYTVVYENPDATEDNFAIIDFFVEVEHPSTHNLLTLAIVQHLNMCVFAVNGQCIPHMLNVSSRQTRYIPIQSIKSKCVLIESCNSGVGNDIVCKIFNNYNLCV